ncbi:unnamed protein product, partial [Laminaria digitata]
TLRTFTVSPQVKSANRHPSQDCGRNGNSMPETQATEIVPAGVDISACTNRDVLTLLAELLSNQYSFFAEVSKDWRDAWGDNPKTTQAITADTSVSQLQWSFDGGLKKTLVICERIAEHGGVAVLQCALSNGCRLSPRSCFK